MSTAAATYTIRRTSMRPNQAPHAPKRRRSPNRSASPPLKRHIRRGQIPIARCTADVPPPSRFPPLEVFGRRPPVHAAPSASGRHPKTFTEADIDRALFDHLVGKREDGRG